MQLSAAVSFSVTNGSIQFGMKMELFPRSWSSIILLIFAVCCHGFFLAVNFVGGCYGRKEEKTCFCWTKMDLMDCLLEERFLAVAESLEIDMFCFLVAWLVA